MTTSEPASKDNRPNIIVILADDMGYSDIGCFGSAISTPNIDKLAENGVRFTQMYNCARCCPSRASLLTGLYPHQAGVGHMVTDLGHPSYRGFLNNRCVTIAEVLKDNGYHTLMAGKWHVGGNYDLRKPETWHPGEDGYPYPSTRGFDQFYGTLAGCADYYNPHTLMENSKPITPESDDYYYTDAISDQAAAMIEECAEKDPPFFMYVAYTAPHWPLHALPEDIARYEGKFKKGWDTIRMDRYDRMTEQGIIDNRWKISPRDECAPPWEDVKLKDWEDMRMAVYAAQVDRMDQGIGKIMNALDARNIAENTLVIFLSDNGGCAEFLAEDGFVQQVLWPMRNGEYVRAGNFPGIRPGGQDTYMSYDLPWANASNTPFRLFKHWVHEGGIATPLIMSWPDVTTKQRMVHQSAHVIDIMATCVDAAGAIYPTYYNDNQIQPMEGESLVPALSGKKWARKKPLYWEHEGNCAIRIDDWKMVKKYPGPWEMYNMEQDRTEQVNLIEGEKSRFKAMQKLYNEWADRIQVLPMKRLKEMAPIEDIPTEE